MDLSLIYSANKQTKDSFPHLRRPPTPELSPGWPTLTIETGLSGSLSQRRKDALWWVYNSSDEVRANNKQFPSNRTVITRSQLPLRLTLPFAAVYDRAPVAVAGEGDIVFTAQDFLGITSNLF
ncbi:hypothetical protein N7516_006284 [Penicillium verrucosum]|uniref:uncharacterized protein n=1 Tax=Penicillium verrucosum TaxID=60171 RepID=UPI0025455E07|nr:uncharacterized protein N7516_006284 [Penicillium verrucosum]KAJ5931795.1 hypothetical protein N7516_006284 [Penicillium verrucosum]